MAIPKISLCIVGLLASTEVTGTMPSKAASEQCLLQRSLFFKSNDNSRRIKQFHYESAMGTESEQSLVDDGPLEADFVIVGAGTAGSLLAERLSRFGSVLILECGSELPESVRSRIPGAGCTYDQLPDGEHVCGKRCNRMMSADQGYRDSNGLNFRVGPGGTSVMAVGSHFRGGEKYWKDLAKSYGKHWILPKDEIGKLEREMSVRTVPAAVDEDHVLFAQALSRHLSLVSENSSTMGKSYVFPRYQDSSGWSTNAYTQFLKKAVGRENVRILTKACARSLVKSNDGRAPTVKVRHHSKTLYVHAKREVILAAGALGSPALLQRSGLSVAAVRDQADVRIAWRCGHCKYRNEFLQALRNFFKKRNARKLPKALTLPGYDAGALTDLGGMPALILASTEFVASEISTGAVPDDNSGSVFEVHVVLLQPHSFETTVSPSGKLERPLRLKNPQDLDAALRGIRLVRKVIKEHAALAELRLGEELFPGSQYQTDRELREVLQAKESGAVASFQSATASCRLGKVVDGQMRVVAMPSVRVVDASVLPRPPLGRTLFPTLVVAEVASRLIMNATM